MSTKLSIAEILAKLEARVAFHRQQASHHVAREAWHREQSTHHSAELEKVLARFEAFKAAATEAADLAVESVMPREGLADDLPPGKTFTKSKLILRVVQSMEEGTPFSAAQVTAEVNRRFRERMKKPVDRRVVSTNLRRLRDAGQIREVEEGRSFHEAKYRR
jgi:hypothetical protein